MAEELLATLREALSNVARHARASSASVSLAAETTPGQALLRVADNGGGLPDPAPEQGYGLRNMRERAERLGGHCTISSGPDGTVVEWAVPLKTP